MVHIVQSAIRSLKIFLMLITLVLVSARVNIACFRIVGTMEINDYIVKGSGIKVLVSNNPNFFSRNKKTYCNNVKNV